MNRSHTPKTETKFGERLAMLRKAKGLTQQQLSDMVQVSRRVIAYYEGETKSPPAHMIVPLAKALEITPDELLGVVEPKEGLEPPRSTALRKKLKAVESLPKKDQKAILHYIDMILKNKEIQQKT